MKRGLAIIGKGSSAISLPSLKVWVVALLVAMGVVSKAQVLIPDVNFRNYLGTYYPGSMNGNYLDTLSSAVVNATTLHIQNAPYAINDITGIEYFRNVTYIYVSAVPGVTRIGNLPPHLVHLEISNENIKDTFPALPSSMRELSITGASGLRYLKLNDSLVSFKISPCDSLGYFDPWPTTLQTLLIGYTTIDTLPYLPAGLTDFTCSGTYIKRLPPLPAGITNLTTVGDTFLAVPPSLPPGLIKWNCNLNHWDSLPPLPNTLKELDAQGNNLTHLPALPDSLERLIVRWNRLTDLPSLPHHLKYFLVNGNQLTCFPALPPNVSSFSFGGNNITCRPHLLVPPSSCDSCHFLPYCDSVTTSCQYSGIHGNIFLDANHNCLVDTFERNISGYLSLFDTLARKSDNIVIDSTGDYIVDLPSSVYMLGVEPDIYAPNACPSFTVLDIPFGAPHQRMDFGFSFPAVIDSGHNLVVHIATGQQHLCRNNNLYVVYYANNGQDTAFNTVLKLNFDPEIIPLSFTTPFTSQSGNEYTFNLGNLEPQTTGYITIVDSVSCNAVIRQAACVQANIYPLPDSIPSGPTWDHSHLEVHKSVTLANDTIVFAIVNTGTGGMVSPTAYRIYEDDILLANGRVQLGIQDSILKSIYAAGKTYRLEADQAVGHPGHSRPRQFVELAGNPPYSLHYITTIGQDDLDDWVEIACHEIMAAFDPNAKEVFPSGTGASHFINPEDEELKYVIRFQNTGNDTAFSVIIRDTIDLNKLDIASFSSIVSSNSFAVNIDPTGLATWTIQDYIPDSTTNESASHGFVSFTINQKPNLAPGTVIKNFADIYFDANAPVRTDTAWVTLQTKELIATLSVANIISDYRIAAYPNPFDDEVNFRIDGYEGKALKFELVNILGQTVITKENIVGASFMVNCKGITSGLYVFRISADGNAIGTGKIIAK